MSHNLSRLTLTSLMATLLLTAGQPVVTRAQDDAPANSSSSAIVNSDAKKIEEKLSGDVKANCDRHFPGRIQGELRSTCASATQGYARYGNQLARTRCRVDNGEEPRLVMACLIGTVIADDLSAKRDDFKRKLQLCAEHYPQHTEIDAFLQESCLTGIHSPSLVTGAEKPRLETCSQITPERSFLGPCAVGLSLAQESNDAPSSQQNKLCEQYFDHRKFHMGYRACLNARGAALLGTEAADDLIKGCSNLVSGGSEVEQAACLVGLNIHRYVSRKDDVTKRFQKCGDNKVSYQDRDFLACLTAASLLDFGNGVRTGKNGAEAGCKDVFKAGKSRSRGDCLNSLNTFQ